MSKSPTLVPYLTVKDIRKSVAFYEKAFGFKLDQDLTEHEGVASHAEMLFSDARILLGAEGAYGSDKKSPASLGISVPVSVWVYCSDVDAQYKKALAGGAVSLMEPHDAFWGDRACMVKDPDGYEWGFCKNL
jgi:PhnB protein